MSVVGLDFGNLSVLIAQAGRGGVDVILNDSSNRQTASYVSIQGKQRFLGDSGAAMVSDTLRNLQRECDLPEEFQWHHWFISADNRHRQDWHRPW